MRSINMYPFPKNTSIAISGTTGSGKTMWVYKLLKQKDVMFEVSPTQVLYCYGIYQPVFQDMEREMSFINVHQGLPDIEMLIALNKNSLIILDDLARRIVESREMEELFTMGVHHRQLSVIYINQNMYCQGKYARTINLNTHFMILLKNPRDVSQVACLARQVFPHQSKAFIEAYQDCMKNSFGYLVIDLSPQGEDEYRLRTDIFKDDVTVIYKRV